jgi:hypothetical protein
VRVHVCNRARSVCVCVCAHGARASDTVCVCARARERACVRVLCPVRTCVCVCVRACMRPSPCNHANPYRPTASHCARAQSHVLHAACRMARCVVYVACRMLNAERCVSSAARSMLRIARCMLPVARRTPGHSEPSAHEIVSSSPALTSQIVLTCSSVPALARPGLRAGLGKASTQSAHQHPAVLTHAQQCKRTPMQDAAGCGGPKLCGVS